MEKKMHTKELHNLYSALKNFKLSLCRSRD